MSFDVKQLKRFEKWRLKNARRHILRSRLLRIMNYFLWHSLSPQDSNYIASVYFDRSHMW